MNSGLTSDVSWFDDFTVGQKFRHARGKTVSELENVFITNLVMNTASAHFDEHAMKDHRVGQRVVFGGVTASIVIGLASQDLSDNAIQEIGLTDMRLAHPVVHGDTLYSYSEILGLEPDMEHSGKVVCKHWGLNQRNEVVFEAVRTVRVARRDRVVLSAVEEINHE